MGTIKLAGADITWMLERELYDEIEKFFSTQPICPLCLPIPCFIYLDCRQIVDSSHIHFIQIDISMYKSGLIGIICNPQTLWNDSKNYFIAIFPPFRLVVGHRILALSGWH